MKKLLIIFSIVLLTFSLLNISCGNKKLKTKVVTVDNVVSYEIFDDDFFVPDTLFAENKININTVAFSFDRLKSFEDESFSKPLMDIIYNSSDDMYEKVIDYLSSAKFDEDYFVLFNNRTTGSVPSDVKMNNDFPLIKDGIIIGEYMFQNNGSHYFPYEFIYFSKNHLIQTTIELNRPDMSMFENCKEFFSKRETESSLPYYWVSDQKKKEFFEILESKKYKKLPEEFQLLRESKDLFLRTLTILEQ
jgi:hypothetical protein